MRKTRKQFRLPRASWILAGLLLGFSSFLAGCAASTPQARPEQLASQLQASQQKNPLQEKLLARMSQASLKDYQDYTVGPEDLLEISFFGQDDLNREPRVNGQGDIILPLVGQVKVSGLSPHEIGGRLEKLYKEKEFINSPQISVKVKEYRYQRVMLTGAVTQPGSYEMIGPRTLLEMLGKAGGLSDKSGDVAFIIRSQTGPARLKAMKESPAQPFSPGSETIMIDLDRLLAKGAMELNLSIKNGDVIYVPHAKNAYVLGAVRKPGNVPLKGNLTATQAVAMAGGLDPALASNNLTIVRLNEKGESDIVPINLKRVTNGEEKDTLLKENDIVVVKESIIRRFAYDFKNLLPGSLGASVPLIP